MNLTTFKSNQMNKELDPKALIDKAHDALTRKKGRPEYAPNAHEIQAWIDGYLNASNQPSERKVIDNCPESNDDEKWAWFIGAISKYNPTDEAPHFTL